MSYCTRMADEFNTDLHLHIEMDGEDNRISIRDLASPESRDQLKERCLFSQNFIISNWAQQVFRWPESLTEFLVDLIHQSQGKGRVASAYFPIVFYSDLFEATLLLNVPSSSLQAVAKAKRTVVLIAQRQCPEVAAHAAQRIFDWLSRNGIRSDTKREIEAEIRGDSSSAVNSARVSPQEAARRVLADLQARREESGESEIDTPPIYFLNQEFYQWTGRSWELIKCMLVLITQILQRVVPEKDLSTQYINSVYANVKALAYLDLPLLRFPVYIRDQQQGGVVSCKYLNFSNGILDLNTLDDDGGLMLLTHDPRIFGAPCFDLFYDPAATCPFWRQTLSEILPPRSENDNRQLILQEFFGYCLMLGDFRIASFLILTGLGSNGKSVVLEVLGAMLGAKNTSHMPLDGLENQFRLWNMVGKLANIATDMPRIQKVAEGLLKQLVSGEPCQVNRKHLEPTTMYPTAKLIFATNHLPSFSDVSDGMWRRMIVVPFDERFLLEQCDADRGLRIIQAELPGILIWALEGARRLLRQRSFTRCVVCERAKSEHRQDSDPFAQFLDDCCDIGPENTVSVGDVYQAYKNFCEANGRNPKGSSEIGKQLKSIPGIEKLRHTTGARPYYYQGISLRSQNTYRSIGVGC